MSERRWVANIRTMKLTPHPSHDIESWNDHDECVRCGLNTSIGDEGSRLEEPCEATGTEQATDA